MRATDPYKMYSIVASVDEWRHYDRQHYKVDGPTLTSLSESPHSAYGEAAISSGQRTWRIRIDRCAPRLSHIYVGIGREKASLGPFFRTSTGRREAKGYAYHPVRCCLADTRT